MKKTKLFIIISLIILFLGGMVQAASAATLYFSPSSGSRTTGSTFLVDVYVSSEEQLINAASGEVSFPADKLEVTSISKSGSIFSLWVEEPSFSNKEGTISFEGIVLNPGFIGSSGKIITITFRAKTAGEIPLSFSSGAVLANDGEGTNILSGFGSALFSARVPVSQPEEVGNIGVPLVLEFSSPTHPDSSKWYANANPLFKWNVPSGVQSMRLLVSRSSTAQPTHVYTPPISERQLEDLDDGVWYFCAQFRDNRGWGEIGRFKFQIDTTPPASFELKVEEGKETQNPQPTLLFETTDEMSGIDHYEVKVGNASTIETSETKYQLPVQDPGEKIIIVKAVDKAGNYRIVMEEINILAIQSPEITDYSQELIPGNTLFIEGTSLPETKIKVFIQKDKGNIEKLETKSGQEGNWKFIWPDTVERGVYQVWVQAEDSLGAQSNPTEKISISVSPPVFIQVGELVIDYLSTVITLLILIAVIIAGIFWGWRKIKKKRRLIKKEVSEAEESLYQAFKTLEEETKREIAKLDGRPGLNKREKEIHDNLKKSLNKSEKIVSKEIRDIEERLK